MLKSVFILKYCGPNSRDVTVLTNTGIKQRINTENTEIDSFDENKHGKHGN